MSHWSKCNCTVHTTVHWGGRE